MSSRNLGFGISLIVIGAISLGLSGFLHRNREHDFQINGSDLCESSPFEYARPFYAEDKGDNGGDIFCGYSQANTIYRIILAGLTIIWGFFMCIGVTDKFPVANYWKNFFFAIFWFGATTADCTAIAMSYGVCSNFFGGPNLTYLEITADYECSSHRYGLAVAFDFLLSIIVLSMFMTNSPAGTKEAA